MPSKPGDVANITYLISSSDFQSFPVLNQAAHAVIQTGPHFRLPSGRPGSVQCAIRCTDALHSVFCLYTLQATRLCDRKPATVYLSQTRYKASMHNSSSCLEIFGT